MLQKGQRLQGRLARRKMRNGRKGLSRADVAHRFENISKVQQQFASVESVVHDTFQVIFPGGRVPGKGL
ncbi:hypothetical protein [Paraburkholderia sp. CNPSo 3272]|uniref:hypothetical protein n=1 Tax=Paraburkholderia sp. CNPSo 3272 TaxID=2940931 RepID=UPI0020B85257|nr:hypothetical protein [Paraburkholderia sp. CNPSo 3272]